VLWGNILLDLAYLGSRDSRELGPVKRFWVSGCLPSIVLIVVVLDNQRCTHLGFHLDRDWSAAEEMMRIRRGSVRRGNAKARASPNK
jgi:hypothetical protein